VSMLCHIDMTAKSLAYYIHAFSHLRVNVNRTMTPQVAPHKPVLLLSIVQAFEQGLITDNRMYITPVLVGLFKSIWNRLVSTSDRTPAFTLPYYHLKSEPFWQLVPQPGYEGWINQTSTRPSFANLNVAVAYARIDDELCCLLLDAGSRQVLRQSLLQQWFPEAKETVLYASDYLDTLRHEMREETGPVYKARIEQLQTELDKETYQEELFVRGGVFKREIPRLYDYTCCISGLRVDATVAISMIDACHIVPFSESHNDTVTNGLALCPNLHRAFDRGLISLTDGYELLVSDRFTESDSAYAIRPFTGQRIRLPAEEKLLPDPANLAWHRQRVFQS